MEVVFDMPFLTFSNNNVQFAKKKFTLKNYTNAKVLSTIQRIKLINKEKFAKSELDENITSFVVYINSFSLRLKMTIYTAKEV